MRMESVGQILHSASAERELHPAFAGSPHWGFWAVWMDGGTASVSHLDGLAMILVQERNPSDVTSEVDEQIDEQIAFLFAPVVLY